MKRKWPWIIGGITLLLVVLIPSVLRFLVYRGIIGSPYLHYSMQDRYFMHVPGGSHMGLTGGFMSFGMVFGFLFFIGITTLIVLGIIALVKVVSSPKPTVVQQQVSTIHCTECGSVIQEGWKHCPNCGAGVLNN